MKINKQVFKDIKMFSNNKDIKNFLINYSIKRVIIIKEAKKYSL